MPVARAFIVTPVQKIGHVHLKWIKFVFFVVKCSLPEIMAPHQNPRIRLCAVVGLGVEHSQPRVCFGTMML